MSTVTQKLKQSVAGLLGRERVNRLTGPVYDWQARRRSQRFLQHLNQRHLLINLGCGPTAMADWINVDMARGSHVDVVLDITTGLPFLDESCQAVICEHVIEHLTREHGLQLLKDCRRVLEPGGVVRISTPDAGLYLKSYAGDGDFLRWAMERRPAPTPLDRINMVMREDGQHLWLYDGESLMRLFQDAGFSEVTVQPAGVSTIDVLNDIDHPGRRAESVYVEGIKSTDDSSLDRT